MLDQAGTVTLVAVALILLLVAGFLARLISRWAAWEPAGPIALIAAVPLVPYVPLAFSLSLDDLFPLLGLAMLAWRSPVPRLTTDRILRVILVAVVVTILARIASALVNGGDAVGTVSMLGKAIARPVLLIGIAGYVAVAMPAALRRRCVAICLAAVGTFEAAFGLLAFTVTLPGGMGIEGARPLTSLYGVCPGRVSGTLGISPNFLGAVFVVTLPFTVGLALGQVGWRRWTWGLATSLQVAALALTFTRSSILLGVAVVLVFILIYRRVLLMGFVTAASMALVVAILSVGCTTSSGGHGLQGNPVGVLGGRFTDSNDRLALWYAAAHIAVDHPIFGVGLGKMQAVLKADPEKYGRTPFGTATNSAHNTILLAGVETGFIGAIAAIVLNITLGIVAIRCAWRGRRRSDPLLVAAAFAVAALLVQGMVNNLFEVGVTSALLAFVVGAFGAGMGDRDPDAKASPYGLAVDGSLPGS